MNAESPPEQTRRDHARVVEDEELIAMEKRWELCKQMIFDCTAKTVQGEQSRVLPTLKRPLGNLRFGQIVFELVKTHSLSV